MRALAHYGLTAIAMDSFQAIGKRAVNVAQGCIQHTLNFIIRLPAIILPVGEFHGNKDGTSLNVLPSKP
jgi:hypothetical protein